MLVRLVQHSRCPRHSHTFVDLRHLRDLALICYATEQAPEGGRVFDAHAQALGHVRQDGMAAVAAENRCSLLGAPCLKGWHYLRLSCYLCRPLVAYLHCTSLHFLTDLTMLSILFRLCVVSQTRQLGWNNDIASAHTGSHPSKCFLISARSPSSLDSCQSSKLSWTSRTTFICELPRTG